METALERAKEALGGPAGLAKALGNITSQAISQWRQVPHDRVIDVERVTGISRHELRPDLSKIFVGAPIEQCEESA